jgi:predicted nucleic acid-binding protein
MTRLFADTSYWIALLNPDDELHSKAAVLAQRFSSAGVVTSEMVLVEVLNSFSRHGSHLRHAAGKAVQGILGTRNLTVIAQTSEHFRDAIEVYMRAADKSWSLTDCASFEIMRAERLSEALTHDRHFGQAGFKVLMA